MIPFSSLLHNTAYDKVSILYLGYIWISAGLYLFESVAWHSHLFSNCIFGSSCIIEGHAVFIVAFKGRFAYQEILVIMHLVLVQSSQKFMSHIAAMTWRR